jgi:hypothetical protein
MQLGLFVLLLMVMMKKGLMLLLMMMIANSFCTRIYSIIADANKGTWLTL